MGIAGGDHGLDRRAPGIRAAAPRPSSDRRPAPCPRRVARGRCPPRDWARSRAPRGCRPRCRAIIRFCPTESDSRTSFLCAAAIASSERLAISLSATRHASSSVSRTMRCMRRPNLTSRPLARGAGAHVLDLLADLLERLAPGQVDVGLRGGELVRGLGRAAEPDGQRLLHRREQQPRALRPSGSGPRNRPSRPPAAGGRSSGTRRRARSARHATGRCRRPRAPSRRRRRRD